MKASTQCKGCGQPVEQAQGRGAPKRYCAPGCRPVRSHRKANPLRSVVPWTAAEDTALRAAYPYGDLVALAASLGRTYHAIVSRARTIGVRRLAPIGCITGRAWTAEEDDAIRRDYPAGDLDALVSSLGRTRRAIEAHARHLGLPSPFLVRWSADEEDQLRADYPHGDRAALSVRLRKSLAAIASHAKQLGLCREVRAIPVSVWTARQDDVLRECYPHGDLDLLARDLGRTDSAIHQRASVLGIARLARPWEAYAQASGWPTDLPPRQISLLNFLGAVGLPIDVWGLSASLSKSVTDLRKDLYPLRRRGLVIAFRQPEPPHRALWTLGPLALSLLEDRCCEQDP